jgi:glycosyltransferase involved in cell wall biosynthesis
MLRVLLLHTNTEYATTLDKTVTSLDTEYETTVVSRVPISERLSHVLSSRYDLIQVDELMVNGVLAWGASVVPGTPFVASIRGWADYTNAHGQYGRLKNASIRLRSRAVLRRAAHVIFLSRRTRDAFTGRYPVVDSSVIGRPIRIDHYAGGTARDGDTFDLLTVTNLRYEEKFRGVTTVLEGLRGAFDRHENLRYVVAGDGDYLSELREFLADYPHADRVELLGFRDDVPDLLAGADAFVYVSFLDSLSTTVLEAQAAGLPVIAGDASGVPEAVGDAGVVRPATPEGIHDAVDQVVTDDEHRESLAARSTEKMAAYNERCARRHVEVWDRVLGGGDHS